MMAKDENGKSEDSCAEDDNIPWLCLVWLKVANSLPSFQMFNLDWSFTVLSFFAFSIIKFAIVFVFTNYFGFPPADDPDTIWAVGCAIGVVQSSILCPILITLFLNTKYNPSATASSEKAWWYKTADAALQFCTAYMLQDTFWTYLVGRYGNTLNSTDYMFLGHHFVTAYYMTSVRLYKAGHQSAMTCMLSGEITNPAQNTYSILETVQKLFPSPTGTIQEKVFFAVRYIYSLQYFTVRGLIATPLFLHLTYSLWTEARSRGLLPVWQIFIYTLLVWGVLVGSYDWILSTLETVKEETPLFVTTFTQIQRQEEL